MTIKGVSFLGIRTGSFQSMKDFFANVLKAELIHERSDFVAFRTMDGDRIELFGPAEPNHRHFDTGPVGGFEVDDIIVAKEKLEDAGIELLSGIMGEDGRTQWVHFRAPDGNVYEIVKHANN